MLLYCVVSLYLMQRNNVDTNVNKVYLCVVMSYKSAVIY